MAMRSLTLSCLLSLGSPWIQAQWTPLNPVTGLQRQADGVLISQARGHLRLQVCTDSILHVRYPGADGDFTLYEDENDTYNYEKGQCATLQMHWDEARQTLTIGERKGQFPGMLPERAFHLVMVGLGHGVGIVAEARPDRVLRYTGKAISITP